MDTLDVYRIHDIHETPAKALRTFDYADAFGVRHVTGSFGSAEQFLRGVLEGAPWAARQGMQGVWRRALKLRLHPLKSPDTVVGWPIAECTPERIALAAEGPLIKACMVGRRLTPTAATLTVFIEYQKPGAALVWAGVGPGHRMFVPGLLRQQGNVASHRLLPRPA